MKFNAVRIYGSYRAALLAGAAALAASSSGVSAQTADPDADDAPLEEEGQGPGEPDSIELDNVIIVTATKREQTLQDVPVSVTVTSGETLEQAQIRDVADLQTVAPSLRVSTLQSSSNTTFIIRGFGNGANNLGIEPSVAVFVDNVYRSRTAGALNDLINVQRIEVLNGPQSTLFGKNASAGVISVVTREPQFAFTGGAEIAYGNYDNIVVKGDVTGPITDELAFSIDGSYNVRDGYGTIVNLDEDINDRDRWTARGQLLFDDGGPARARLIADYNKIDEVCCIAGNVLNGPTGDLIFAVGGQLDPEDLFSYETFLNVVPANKIENYGVSLQSDFEFGALTLTSITAYRELKNFFDQDVDFTSAAIVTETRDQAAETFTQELRLTSDFDGPVNFLLGGFYFNEDIEQDSLLDLGDDARPFFDLLADAPAAVAAGRVPQLGTLSGVEFGLGLPQNSIFSPGAFTRETFFLDNESWSVFGTVDFEPVDGLVLTGGFNYTDDKKDFGAQATAFDELANINLVDAFLVGALAPLGIDATDPAQFAAFQQNSPLAPLVIAAALGNPDGLDLSPVPGLTANPLLGLTSLQFQPPFLDLPNAVEDGQTRDDDWSYTLRAAYDFNDRVNVYASYATGFKASSVNLSRDSRPIFGDFVPGPGLSTILAPSSPIRDAGLAVPNLTTGSRFAGPEEAEVYELGVKAQFPRWGFNLAVFDQTLEGFQDFLFTGTGFQLSNAGEQSVKGFEFDTTINPVDPLVLTFAITHLDPLYDSFVESPIGDLSGLRPASIPSFAISTSANYVHDFGMSGNKLLARIDYSHESNTQLLNGVSGFGSNEAAREIARNYRREINLVNAALTFQMENGFEIGAWARNLFDDQYIGQIFPSVAQAGSISGYPSQPRTYGGVVRFRF